MKLSRLAIAALALWIITIAVFAWFFIKGNTTSGSDNRTAVVLAPAERELILSEMRNLLIGVQGILEGANNNDVKQIASAARKVGMASAADVNPALMAKLPLELKQLGMSVHHDMDDLAAAADAGKPVPELQKMLTSTMNKCVACHARWQLKSTN